MQTAMEFFTFSKISYYAMHTAVVLVLFFVIRRYHISFITYRRIRPLRLLLVINLLIFSILFHSFRDLYSPYSYADCFEEILCMGIENCVFLGVIAFSIFISYHVPCSGRGEKKTKCVKWKLQLRRKMLRQAGRWILTVEVKGVSYRVKSA